MAANPWTITSASGYTPSQVAHQNPKPHKPKPHRPPKPHPPKRPVYQNPFAPKTDAQLQAEAAAAGQAYLGPLMKQITDAMNQRSAQGQAAITGYTKDLAGAYQSAGPATQAAYQQAQQAQGAVDTQMANRLGAFGGNLATEQGQQLASINAPQVTAALTGQTAQTATGAANAGFAQGSAELGRLISQGAAGGAYAAKLPGIAAMTGAQNTKQFQAQLNHELAQQLASAQTQAAQQVFQTYQHLKDLEVQKAAANQSGMYKSGQLALDAQYKAAQQAYKQAVFKWKKTSKATDQALAKAKAAQTAHHQSATEAQAKANAAAAKAKAKASSAQSGANYYWGTNPKTGKRVRIPKGYRYNQKGELVKIPGPKKKGSNSDGLGP